MKVTESNLSRLSRLEDAIIKEASGDDSTLHDIRNGMWFIPTCREYLVRYPWWQRNLRLQELIKESESNSNPIAAPTKGEQKMNVSDIRILQQLASKTVADDLSKYTMALADGTDEAMKEILADEAKEAAKVQARILLNIVRRTDTSLDSQVAAIRATRAKEKYQLDNLKAIERARDYAAETKNYLPLLHKLDGYVSGVADKDCQVPEDWKSAAKAF